VYRSYPGLASTTSVDPVSGPVRHRESLGEEELVIDPSFFPDEGGGVPI